ncbi:MAG: thioredoxin family protein [Legionellaceae bacterium]|nr:thioredoxin family protein [Legionellaceae bacterium]
MSKTPSAMLPLGTIAPNFSLINVLDHSLFQLNKQKPMNATLIMFICNHCPYVKHVNAQLTALANDYIPKDVAFIAINANDIDSYPMDRPEEMVATAKKHQFPFPYLFDETQEVAKAYQAACTPDFFLFDDKLKLVYRGQLDSSRPGNAIPVTGESVRNALDALLEKRPIDPKQYPSLGCNIKWKAE